MRAQSVTAVDEPSLGGSVLSDLPRRPEIEIPFDSVICFGSVDWWYHNRGHFDLRIMRELSKRIPVIYVNSIGMRFPRVHEGAMFMRRIHRKLSSIRRGLVGVSDRFSVYSPISIPDHEGQPVYPAALSYQVRWAARQMGFRSPLLWVSNPTSLQAVDRIAGNGLVYNRTDRYEAFPGVKFERIRTNDRILKQLADVTVYCSSELLEHERYECSRAHFVDHGVDFDAFASRGTAPEPEDLRYIDRPRIGFIGSMDSHTFDSEIFSALVKRMPDHNFVMVGPTTLSGGWLDSSNVHLLGQKSYDEVSDYAKSCDVLIMPWNRSSWIKACNPIKLKEYLATGRPVVSTWFPELKRYEGFISVAKDSETFEKSIRQSLKSRSHQAVHRQRKLVMDDTWERQGERVLQLLSEVFA